jgi:general secretion pathway protein K
MKRAFSVLPVTNNRGMALVLTLMVVAIITAMVVEFAYGVYINTTALYTWQTSQKLSLAAKSATRLASKLISERSRSSFTSGFYEISQKIPYDDPDGIISIRIEDENAKFNLNSLVNPIGTRNETAYASFIRLLNALSVKTEIADRIVDWIDPNSEPWLQDSENGAKNGKLDSVDEILMIPGIDSESYEKLSPYVTIYTDITGLYGININSAGVPVLMSLSDSINKDLAERIVTYREVTPFGKASDMQYVGGIGSIWMSFQQYVTFDGTAFKVMATAQSGDVKRIIESVIEGNTKTVKYWKEN